MPDFRIGELAKIVDPGLLIDGLPVRDPQGLIRRFAGVIVEIAEGPVANPIYNKKCISFYRVATGDGTELFVHRAALTPLPPPDVQLHMLTAWADCPWQPKRKQHAR